MNDYNDKTQYDYRRPDDRPGPGPGPGPGDPPPKGSNGDDLGSWIFNIAMLFIVPPIGLALTVAHALGSDVFKRLFSALSRRFGARVNIPRVLRFDDSSRRADDAFHSPDAPEAKKSVRAVDAGSGALKVFGWILVAFGALAAIGAGSLWRFVTAACLALGGGAMLLRSSLSRRKAKAFARCITVSGREGLVQIAPLAATLGMTPAALEKQLTEMIDHGLYGERAYIDHRRGLLVIDPEDMRDVYRREDEAEKSAEQRQHEAQQSEYERIVAAIGQADLDIDDEAMSEKIRRMQTITAAIFREVEAHPEKKGQITRFMNYYLPTTLKLLNAYARIEKQGVSGENMAKAKADIEGIADTLVDGYEKQLDRLYRSEAADIAGDVRVIEKMMRSDGLTGGESPFRWAEETTETKGMEA